MVSDDEVREDEEPKGGLEKIVPSALSRERRRRLQHQLNPAFVRERARRVLALSLLALIAVFVLGSTAALALDRLGLEELKDIASLFFGPLVALLGAAVGFYYAHHSS